MIVSLNWIREFIDVSLDHHVLAEKFNLMSAEVSRLNRLVNASGLVIGDVKTCEQHPDASKLHVCQVDVGKKTLQIICGASNIAQGQKVIVALEGAILPNAIKITATKIRGVYSYGMICSLDELSIDRKYHQEEGIHVLPDDAPVGEDALHYCQFDDLIMELDLTPNRADLLSHLGVAYDLYAIAGGNMHIPPVQVNEISEKNPVNVFTETNGCPSYYARVVKNITVSDSPQWLKTRLIACGIRPINNVVDISNYVLLELGQPLHFFDYHQLGSKQIVVRQAKNGELLNTLDGKSRILTEEDMVITNGSRPIALAGVMGGAETEVSPSTSMVLIESATFDPIRIRKTSKRLDLRSESSIRFERGLDPKRTKWAVDRAAMLLEQLCGGDTLKGINFFDMHNVSDREVKISLNKLQQITGRSYLPEDVEMVFDRLQFKFSESDGMYRVHVPSRRQDIASDQDLVEEIVRIHGYRYIPTSFPQTMTFGKLSVKQRQKRAIKNLLLSQGLNETITYSLVSEAESTMFDMDKLPTIRILNPMSEDRAVLRHSLLPSLINVLAYNKARKCDDVHLFEIGNGYFPEEEIPLLAGLMTASKPRAYWQDDRVSYNYYTVKGIVEAVLDTLSISGYRFEALASPLPCLHPGISAAIMVNHQQIGILGRLHPELEQARSLDETIVFEINLGMLLGRFVHDIMMETVSKYPSVSRDLALVVDRSLPAQALIDAIKEKASPNMRDVSIFDVFIGEQLGSDKKSVAFNLVFQNDNRTLETEEVDTEIEHIVQDLTKKYHAEIRSM